jgi:hypothetical protein
MGATKAISAMEQNKVSANKFPFEEAIDCTGKTIYLHDKPVNPKLNRHCHQPIAVLWWAGFTKCMPLSPIFDHQHRQKPQRLAYDIGNSAYLGNQPFFNNKN